MKTKLHLKRVYGIVILMYAMSLFAQQGDSLNSNYFEIYNERLANLTKKAAKTDVPLNEVNGYKDFREWALHYSTRYGENGDLAEYFEAMEATYDTGTDTISDLILDWHYIAPDSLWPRLNGGSPGGVGQGLVISLWADNDDPDHILAGTQHGGGLWKTTDGGDNWENIAKNERRIQGVFSIFVDPDDHDEIYVTSSDSGEWPGSYSYGLFYTFDGGGHWQQNRCWIEESESYLYPFGSAYISPRAFLKHPSDSIMYLATPGYVYQSTNSGVTWKIIIDKTNESPYHSPWNGQHFMDMEFDPGNPDTMYVCGPEAYRVVTDGTTTDTTNITASLITNSASAKYAKTIFVDQNENFPNKVYFTVRNDTIKPDSSWQYCVVYNKMEDSYTVHTVDGYTFKNTFTGQLQQCEVSPLDENKIIGGGTTPRCLNLSDNTSFHMGYGHGFHNDNRSALFLDDGNGNEIALFGTDGGLTKIVNPEGPDSHFEYIANDGTNGIRNLDVQGFDCSQQYPDIMVMGNSHVGVSIRKTNRWYKTFEGGDVQSVLIDPENANNIYITRYATEEIWYTNDMSETSYGFYEYPNNYPPPVLGFRPNDTKTLYVGDRWRVLEFDTDSLCDSASYIAYYFASPFGDGLPLEPDVRNFAFSNDLPNIFFVGTDRYFSGNYWNDPATHINAFFRVEIMPDSSLNFTDLSENLYNGLRGGPVTGLTYQINGQDTIVWAGFGSTATANGDEKNRVYFSKDLGEEWHPMETGLPERVPVNDMQYYKEDDMVFLTSDAGVYLFNPVDSVWENIVNNMPPMTYNHIRFSPMKDLIRVSSHGHGIWEASLHCDYTQSPIVIDHDTTWATDREIYSDVIIEDSASLTITSVVSFTEQARLIVKRGGILLVDGGTLTNLCTTKWQGVEVWGDPKQVSAMPYQGMVLMRDGAIIENAETGILAARTVKDETKGNWINLNYAGGIVKGVASVLRNNTIGVKLLKYPAAGYTFNSSTYFTNFDFIVDTMYLNGYDTACLARLSGINNVRFNRCGFMNNTFWDQYGTGIYSFDSKFFVEGYKIGGEWTNGLFQDLRYGIYAIASGTQYYADIRHTTFDGNYRGAYLGGMSNARVTSNDFEIKTDLGLDSYCLYIDNSTGYMIEENQFKSFNDISGIGLIINNSGSPHNQVYNNVFENLQIATSAQNCNRSVNTLEGLKIKCNDYSYNEQDILVIDDGECQNPGISKNQGATGASDMQAGNTFSWEYNPFVSLYSDYDNIEDSPVTYYHHDTLATPDIHIKPKYRSPPPIITTEQQGTIYDKAESCPSSITGGGGGIGVIKGEMGDYENKADSTQAILTALVDGGDSEVLEQQVLQSMPPETYDLYMSLMGKSPYLSDSVLMAAIEKEDVLPNVLIKDILVANPQAAKSDEVMQKIDEKAYPLSDEMLAEVLLGKYITAAKEKLEAQVNWYRHSRAMMLNRLKQYYLSDTINENSNDSLIILLENENSLNEKYELAFAYVQNGDWENAENTLNSISTTFDLNEQQQQLNSDFIDYYTVLDSLQTMDTNYFGLTEQQKTLLVDLANYADNRVGSYARNILISLGEINYDEPILLPEEGFKSGNAKHMADPVWKPYPRIKVYPNPANNHIIVEMLTGNVNGATIDLYDIEGRLIQSFVMEGKRQHKLISLKRFEKGIYLLKVTYDGKTIGTDKISIMN